MVDLFEIDSTFLDIEVVLAKLPRGIYLQGTVNNHGHKASSKGTKIVKGLRGPTSPCEPHTSILLLAGLKVRMCSSRKSSRKAIGLFFILCPSPVFVTDK